MDLLQHHPDSARLSKQAYHWQCETGVLTETTPVRSLTDSLRQAQEQKYGQCLRAREERSWPLTLGNVEYGSRIKQTKQHGGGGCTRDPVIRQHLRFRNTAKRIMMDSQNSCG